MARSHTWQALRLVVGVSPTINIGGAMNKSDGRMRWNVNKFVPEIKSVPFLFLTDIVSRSASPNGGTLFERDEQVY